MSDDRLHAGDIRFPEKDQPLRDDVRTLGAMLGDVLTEQGGPALFERVEATRLATRRWRAGDRSAEADLDKLLTGLTTRDAGEVVQAFSAYFSLVNLAEQIHRIRRRREHERAGSQPGSLRDVVERLHTDGVTLKQIRELLADMRIVPVFTAHPTEATRRTLLRKHQRIARALVERIDPERVTPPESEVILGRIRNDVTIAWQTDEHLQVRPQVADEVEHVLFYISEVIYRVVPVFFENLEQALREVYGEHADRAVPDRLLRFASWVGGDMDGNPNVGPATIRATLTRQRELVLRRYRNGVQELFEDLSQSRTHVGVDGAVLERMAEYQKLMPGVVDAVPTRYREMPYRVFLALVAARIDATLREDESGYTGPQELLDDLRRVQTSLQRYRGRNAGHFVVTRLVRRVETFGFHLATLDVRQDSEVHRRVAGALLGVPGFAGLSAAERLQKLEESLASGSVADEPTLDESEDTVNMGPMPSLDDDETVRTLDVMAAIRHGRERHGTDAVGTYIISMAQGPDDALAVLVIARTAGLIDETGHVPLDVAPLFETVDDLARARETLEALLANDVYREHLAARDHHQMVMIGYSDSAKDAGLAAARQALADAQTGLVAAADAAGVKLTIFHGRGGTVSRGGGKIREAVLAQPPGTVRGRLRVTEQGEIIHAKFGLRGIATRTLELMTGAVLEFSATERDQPPTPPEWRETFELIANESRAAWRTLVHDDPDLVKYFRLATPIDVIERLLIGSRPASRRKQQGIADLRAIPWVFAWTQSRLILPGWYGLGTGLAAAAQAHGTARLREMATGWPLFATLLADAEMVLAKADMGIARLYSALAGALGEAMFPRLKEEFDRTVHQVVSARSANELLQEEPVLRRAIRLRNPYVDPMSRLQVDLLKRWRLTGREDAELERVLFSTVKGIARGLQNTG